MAWLWRRLDCERPRVMCRGDLMSVWQKHTHTPHTQMQTHAQKPNRRWSACTYYTYETMLLLHSSMVSLQGRISWTPSGWRWQSPLYIALSEWYLGIRHIYCRSRVGFSCVEECVLPHTNSCLLTTQSPEMPAPICTKDAAHNIVVSNVWYIIMKGSFCLQMRNFLNTFLS